MARFHENICATTKMSQNRKCTFLLTSPLELESDEHTAALLWGGGWERAHTAVRAGGLEPQAGVWALLCPLCVCAKYNPEKGQTTRICIYLSGIFVNKTSV